MAGPRIISIEWGVLEGKRPRSAGSNARLNAHGSSAHVPMLRLTTEDNISGFGFCHPTREQASELLRMMNQGKYF